MRTADGGSYPVTQYSVIRLADGTLQQDYSQAPVANNGVAWESILDQRSLILAKQREKETAILKVNGDAARALHVEIQELEADLEAMEAQFRAGEP